MDNEKKYTQVGAVIVLAVFIFVVLLTSIGGYGILTRKLEYMLYFDKSVKGLNVGSPIMFRGIRIGKVENIRLMTHSENIRYDDTNACSVEVTVAIEPDKLDLRFDDEGNELTLFEKKFLKKNLVENWMTNMISTHGMSARLQILSLLTGQLYIALDVSHDKNNDVKKTQEMRKHVIPTRNTAAEDIYLILQNNNLPELLNKTSKILNDFVISGKAQALLNNVVNASSSAMTILKDTQNQLSKVTSNEKADIGAAVEKLIHALDETAGMVAQFRKDEAMISEKLGYVLSNAPDLQERLVKAIANINELVTNLNAIASKEGQLPRILENANTFVNDVNGTMTLQKLNKTLDELEGTLRSLRQLSDMLSRRPETLIRGK